MKTFVTSDLHFEHANIFKFCPATRARYKDVDTMREMMIEEWNQQVSPDDKTFILGDIAFCNAETASSIVNRLNGKKILIEGNHDRKLLTTSQFRRCFDSIHSYLEIKVNNTDIIMFHYPIMEWNKMYRGAVHFYGHLHGKPSHIEQFRARDVGMDAQNKVVVEINELIEDALKGSIRQ